VSGNHPTVLLVHGAWHGAWCWTQVIEGLARAGIAATALDLPGHGQDAGPLSDLHGDAARVRDFLDTQDGPVVLVGHSYGGAVITEAGDHPAVVRLVYIAAFNVDEHESCASAAADDPDCATIRYDGRPRLGAGMRHSDDESTTMDPDVAAACFYNHCSPDVIARALGLLGPHPLAALRQHPAAVAWRRKPSVYAVCADDLGVHPDLQRILARRCTTSLEWPSDHSPFLSHPELVVDLLTKETAAASQ
jgi:pimeloyl-ACP methyl ester carboxylesterase